MVTVAIPVLDEAAHLPEQLAALTRQTYRGGWEVLVCDNGSTDGTPDVARQWRSRLPDLRVVDASRRRGLNYARNCGIDEARGDFIVYCDGDDVVGPDWIAGLVCAGANADVVAGKLIELTPPARTGEGAGTTTMPVKHRFLPALPGGNCGMWTDVARELRWDERYTFGSSDIEFSWRAHLGGYRIADADSAVVHLRGPAGLGAAARRQFAYGRSDPLLYRDFRSEGMPRSDPREALRTWGWLAVHSVDNLTRHGRQRWMEIASRRAGRLVGSIEAKVLFP